MPGSKLLFQGWSSNLSVMYTKPCGIELMTIPHWKRNQWEFGPKGTCGSKKESNVSSKGAVGVQLMGDTQQEHPKSPLPQSSVLPKLFLPKYLGWKVATSCERKPKNHGNYPGLRWIFLPEYMTIVGTCKEKLHLMRPPHFFLWNIPFSNTKKLTVLNHPVQFPQLFLLSL